MTRFFVLVVLLSFLGGCAHRIAIEKKEDPHEGHFWRSSRHPITTEDVASSESPFPNR